MRRDLLVAHVDDLDTFVETAVVNIDDMATAKGKDDVDALTLERLGDKMSP